MQPETISVSEIDLPTTDACADALRGLTNQIQSAGKLALGYAQLAIQHAWRAGKVLLRAKEITGHGGFLDWLDKAAPDISADTANRWMRLAKNAELRDLADCSNLTAAYQAVGLLPESPKPDPSDPPLFSFKYRLAKKPEELDEVQRRSVFDQAKPLLQVLEGMGFVKIIHPAT